MTAIAQLHDPILAALADLRATLTELTERLDGNEVELQEIGTGRDGVYRAVVATRTARDHVESAWRSLDYATRNLSGQ